MRIPFAWLSLSLLGGILIASKLNFPWEKGLVAYLILTPLLWSARSSKAFLPLVALTLLVTGFILAKVDREDPPESVKNWTSQERVSLEGVVITDPEVSNKGRRTKTSFVLEAKNIGKRQGQDFEIIDISGRVQINAFHTKVVPVVGARVRIRGKLEPPRPLLNPGGFDYAGYLASRKIYAVMTAYGKYSLKTISTEESSPFLRTVSSLRKLISKRIDHFYDGTHASLFKALIIGSRQDLDGHLKEDFLKTGTIHLLAISGLNIALVAGSFYFLMTALLKIPLRLAAFAAIFLTILYVFIAGLGIPVQRAGWMAVLGFLALVVGREGNSLNTFFFALLVITVFEPSVIYNVSFQLSFLSVLCLILAYRNPLPPWAAGEGIFQSFVVMLGTFPVIIHYFHIFSPLSLAANFGAIPLFHIGLMASFFSLFLGSLPILGPLFCFLAKSAADLALGWINFWARQEWGYFYLCAPQSWQWVSYYGALIFFVLWQRSSLGPMTFRWVKVSFLFLWVGSFASFFLMFELPKGELTVFAAGKNEMAYFAEEKGTVRLLVNTGRGAPSDQGQWILAPFLRARGIKRLTGIALTSAARKHLGGMQSLDRYFRWRYLFYPASGLKQISSDLKIERRLKEIPLKNGEDFKLGKNSTLLGIDHGKGKMSYLLSAQSAQTFLFLAEVGSDTLDQLKHFRQDLMKTDVLILPAQEISTQRLESLFRYIDPLTAVTSKKTESLQKLFFDYDIPLHDLEENGALTFQWGDADHPTLTLRSFLRGPLENWEERILDL